MASTPTTPLTDDQVRRLHARQVEGETLHDLSTDAGCSPSQLSRRMARLNLPLRRGPGRAATDRGMLRSATRARRRAIREMDPGPAGLTLQAVADALSISYPSAHRLVQGMLRDGELEVASPGRPQRYALLPASY